MNENNEIKRKKLSNCQSNSKILSENNENKEGKSVPQNTYRLSLPPDSVQTFQ